MHVAFLCLESQKPQHLQHKNIRIFIYERRKSKHMEFPSLTWVSSYINLTDFSSLLNFKALKKCSRKYVF